MQRPNAFLLAMITSAALLAACGGSVRQDSGGRQASTDKTPPVALLVDDEGLPMPPLASAVPGDVTQRTRTGLYASAAQAGEFEAALGDRVLHLTLEGGDATALVHALQRLQAEQARKGLTDSAPVLVRGADLRLAALASDRLAAAGRANVWLVTQ